MKVLHINSYYSVSSFYATLKKEEVYKRLRYESFETARMALYKYIESWYQGVFHRSIDFN